MEPSSQSSTLDTPGRKGWAVGSQAPNPLTGLGMGACLAHLPPVLSCMEMAHSLPVQTL